MAEREVLIRQELGAPDPPQEQEFVSRVDETVDCLGEKTVAATASKLLRESSSKAVKSVSGSALTQAPNRTPPKQGRGRKS
jgi:hypothetical protein